MNVFMGVWGIVGLVSGTMFGAFMQSTAAGIMYGALMGLFVAAVSTPKLTPASLTFAPSGDLAQFRTQLKLAAAENGLKLTAESSDHLQFEPGQTSTFNLGGMSGTLLNQTVSVHFMGDHVTIVGPRDTVSKLSAINGL